MIMLYVTHKYVYDQLLIYLIHSRVNVGPAAAVMSKLKVLVTILTLIDRCGVF